MDNAKIKEMIKSDPEAIIGVIEQRVRHIDYTEGKNRNDLLDYIGAKVKGQIWPYLRLARSVRNGYYRRWVEFQKGLKEYGLEDILTRDNNYEPLPEIAQGDGGLVLDIEFFNHLHAKEDRAYEDLFKESFFEWARPALLYAFDKVDTKKSDKEIVSYICKTFYTMYVDVRAKSQGMNRKRRNGKWVYYYVHEVNEFEFTENDVMQVIFQDDEKDFPALSKIVSNLTKKQVKFLIDLHNYVREDVSSLSSEQFHTKYPHKRMNYKLVSKELGLSYESFVKTIQRIKGKVS